MASRKATAACFSKQAKASYDKAADAGMGLWFLL
jgi:hypothetical protein